MQVCTRKMKFYAKYRIIICINGETTDEYKFITSIERKVSLVAEDSGNDAIAWHNLTEYV